MSLLKELTSLKPTIPLYHYTSQNGFMSIVRNHSIWFSHYQYLNDTSEFTYGLNLFSERLDRHLGKDKDKFEFVRSILSVGGSSIYVASLSEANDSLSQWRAYANNGGYSIGFDGRKLSQLCVKKDIFVCKCSYDLDEHEKIIEGAVDLTIQAMRSGQLAPMMSRENSELASTLLKAFCLMKPKSFQDEQEWRLIYSPANLKGEDNVSYRSGKSFIVPYVSMEFEKKDFYHSLHNVTVGPNRYLDNAVVSAKEFVSHTIHSFRQLGPGVVPTNCTYRDS